MSLRRAIYTYFGVITVINFFVATLLSFVIVYQFYNNQADNQWKAFEKYFLNQWEQWQKQIQIQANWIQQEGWDSNQVKRLLATSFLNVVALFNKDGTLQESWQKDALNQISIFPRKDSQRIVTFKLSDPKILEILFSQGEFWTYQIFPRGKLRLTYLKLLKNQILELSFDLTTSQLRLWTLSAGFELSLWDGPKRVLISTWPVSEYRSLGFKNWPERPQWQQWNGGLWLFNKMLPVKWGLNEFRLHGFRAWGVNQDFMQITWFWFLVGLLILFILVGLLAYWLPSKLTHSVKVLQNQAQQLFLSQKPVKFSATGVSELDQLGFALEQISFDVNRYKESLEQKIQELQQTQASLVQAEKMNTLGLLASSLAHEINNPLAVIKSHLFLMKQNNFSQAHDSIRAIEMALERVTKLTQQMLRLAYNRNQSAGQWTLLNEVLDSTLMLLKGHLQKHRIQLEVEGLSSQVWVWFHPDDLLQVLLNLILNAVDASEDGCLIQISWEWMATGGCLHIDDQGQGIPDDVLPKIFEPFFTTKPAGQGTGLGLFISQMIVKRFQAQLKIQSPSPRWNRGTRASLELQPAFHERPESDGP